MSQEKKNILLYSFSGLVVLTLITFSGVKNSSRQVQEVNISIEQEEGNFFTDEIEVMDLMTMEESDYIVGSEISDLSPKSLERRVEINPFVKDAQVYRDLKGNLRVKVTQSKPIARVLIQDGEDKYIDTEGNILPVNAKHTARVPLLESEFGFGWEKNMDESAYGSRVFELIQYIEGSEFWSAQIAQIILTESGEIELLPQITKQKIEFGQPEDLDKKFDKLMIFYTEILPKKGWNTYSRVDLRFEDQIICE